MGWFYTYGASRQDIIRELTDTKLIGNRAPTETKFETLAKFSNGFTQLFAVHQATNALGEVRKWIGVYLLQKSKEGWGYKPMEEAAHPYYYACPLKYLAMVPVECETWREGVRKHWQARKERKAHAVSR